MIAFSKLSAYYYLVRKIVSRIEDCKVKKTIRYSSVIAAALLAVSPVLSSNVANAAETKTAVKADANKETAKTPATKDDKKTESAKAGDSIDNPIKLTSKADVSNVEVEYKDGLRVKDVVNYLTSKVKVFADGKEIKVNGSGGYIRDKDGKIINSTPKNPNPKLKVGDTVEISTYVDYGLKPNTWYQWTKTSYSEPSIFYTSKNGKINAGDDTGIPAEIKANYQIKVVGENKYQITEKTNKYGLLVTNGNDKDGNWYQAGTSYQPDRRVTGKIVDSKTKDAVEIPVESTNDQTQPTTPAVTPSTDDTTSTPSQTPADTNSSADTSATITDTKTEDTKTDEVKKDSTASTEATTQKEDTVKDTSTATTTTAKTESTKTAKAKSTKLMLKHNAYVYSKAGKATKKHGKRILLKKNKFITVLDQAKVYTIKNKKFYRIGKNQYVKVANTTARPAIKTIKKTAVVKGNKTTKVRLYNSEGQLTKKTVKGKKSIKLDRQQKMNGKECYRIQGTSNWILASKVTLKK